MKVIDNRIIAKVEVPNYISIGHKIPDEELNVIIKNDMMHSIAKEIMNKIPVDKMGKVGNDDIIEYTAAVYVFTNEELDEFVNFIKGKG